MVSSDHLTAAVAHPQAQDTMETVEKREELKVNENQGMLILMQKMLDEDKGVLDEEQEVLIKDKGVIIKE
jgi:hypothetical protein